MPSGIDLGLQVDEQILQTRKTPPLSGIGILK
jgi:hypothetical protein